MPHPATSMNPTGEAEGGREGTQPTLHDVTMEAIAASAYVARMWKRLKSNRGAPGIDGLNSPGASMPDRHLQHGSTALTFP